MTSPSYDPFPEYVVIPESELVAVLTDTSRPHCGHELTLLDAMRSYTHQVSWRMECDHDHAYTLALFCEGIVIACMADVEEGRPVFLVTLVDARYWNGVTQDFIDQFSAQSGRYMNAWVCTDLNGQDRSVQVRLDDGVWSVGGKFCDKRQVGVIVESNLRL